MAGIIPDDGRPVLYECWTTRDGGRTPKGRVSRLRKPVTTANRRDARPLEPQAKC